MIERVRPKSEANGGGLYFAEPTTSYRFISSGCTLLDLVVSGGWPLGRVSNIIGDKSTGKTLIAIEACTNFARTYMGEIWYREAEAAFDPAYAEALGMPLSRVDFGIDKKTKKRKVETVEDMFDDLSDCLKRAKGDCAPGLYIVDSLDALPSQAELARKIDEDSYGMEKQKKLGELFRRLIRDVEYSDVHLMIVSQVRAKIGARFGEKISVSGGKALEFYSSQRVMLSHLKTLTRTVGGIKAAVGIRIKAKCIKNKIGQAFRDCEFVIRFGYGVEDYQAALEWLLKAKRTKVAGLSPAKAEDLLDASIDWGTTKLNQRRRELEPGLRRAWKSVQTDLLPTRRKYEEEDGDQAG